MANVTFSSPKLAKDVTVYAIAGDRGTILSLAKAHKVPIPFDCQDGECGSCLVEVSHLSPTTKNAIALTEKEKELLKQLGKITKDEIYDAEVNDMPPRYRLACQCFVRHEDIVVTFQGDDTVPDQGPYITPAAKVFAGGLQIATVDEFLSYAVKVEEDAADHYNQLAKDMGACGDSELKSLFEQLADSARMHLGEARARAGSIDDGKSVPPDYVWPEQVGPEQSSSFAGDSALRRLGVLRVALQGATRAYEFYVSVTATTKNPEVASVARDFVAHKAERLKVIEAWITREEWAEKSAKQPATV
ncbi:2Fe-2S iron-sulfur cluster-binding protein [Methyloceanibacter sp. wino2]|uniref:2Fe-2S iron-sulfur cluster-binding protein n=1 Tax=Methyloceanibacter sp. wino2 TaxID=2170729 RepID=UPI000D3E581E|nr:2Fe-2S iron-sulfur cluster-binding protein [Methyloceanibacter sp. wino2]